MVISSKPSGMAVMGQAQAMQGLGNILNAFAAALSPRLADLAEKAIKALEEGIDPLHNGFLSEHEVTLDECYDLAEFMANCMSAALTFRNRT